MAEQGREWEERTGLRLYWGNRKDWKAKEKAHNPPLSRSLFDMSSGHAESLGHSHFILEKQPLFAPSFLFSFNSLHLLDVFEIVVELQPETFLKENPYSLST